MSSVQVRQPKCQYRLDRVESPHKLIYDLTINTINRSSRCAGQFQVAEVTLKPGDNSNLDSEEHNIKSGDQGDQKRSSAGGGEQSTAHDNGDSNEDKGGIIDEEIISPAAGSNRKRRDSDGIQFFRRINLILSNYNIKCVGFVSNVENPADKTQGGMLIKLTTSVLALTNDW